MGGLAGACGLRAPCVLLRAACWRDGGWGRGALAVALAVASPWILVLVGVAASRASCGPDSGKGSSDPGVLWLW